MSTATSAPHHLRHRTTVGGMLVAAALVAATTWAASAGAADQPTDGARPEIVLPAWELRWLDRAEVAAGLTGLAASASAFASWAGAPVPPDASGGVVDRAAALLDPAVFTHSAMAALAAGLEATGLPERMVEP